MIFTKAAELQRDGPNSVLLEPRVSPVYVGLPVHLANHRLYEDVLYGSWPQEWELESPMLALSGARQGLPRQSAQGMQLGHWFHGEIPHSVHSLHCKD